MPDRVNTVDPVGDEPNQLFQSFKENNHETHKKPYQTSAGWAVGSSQFATSVNGGLVHALNSVGQNLFGSAVFSAWIPNVPIHPVDPIMPVDPIHVFFGDNSKIPVAMNIFTPQDPINPSDPCHAYLQVLVDPNNGVSVKDDSAYAPHSFQILQEVDLSAEKPKTSQCTVAKGSGD